MSENLEKYLTILDDASGSSARTDLLALLISVKNDPDDFVRKQADKLEKSLEQLASGAISKSEFRHNITNIQHANEMLSIKLGPDAKASAHKMTKVIQDLIMNKLLKLIP